MSEPQKAALYIRFNQLEALPFSDDKSRDWYQVRKDWSAAVMVDPETNLICAVEKDVDFMTIAEGMDIYEVAVEDIPSNFVIGSFKYSAGKFVGVGE